METNSTPAIQLNMAKWYSTPASVNCKLTEVPRFLPVVNVPVALVPPGADVDPDPANGSASNATVSLAPGESARITLRANLPMQAMARAGRKHLGVAAVPSAFVPDGTKYQDLPGTGTTVGVGMPSTTTLTYDAANAIATVTVTGGGTTPTGSIAIILNGKQRAARDLLNSEGYTTVHFGAPAPGPGDTLAAYYPGDSLDKASTLLLVGVPVVVLNINATAGIQTLGAGPYSTFNVNVKYNATSQPVPSSRLTVTLTSSANPSGTTSVADCSSVGGQGYFAGPTLFAFNPGDTLTLKVTETDPTNGVVAQTTSQVAIPGFAHLTSPTPDSWVAYGGTITATWSYPANIPNPSRFWIDVNAPYYFNPPSGNDRTYSFIYGTNTSPPVTLARQPFSMEITAANFSYAFTGSGTGVFASRTDDNVLVTVNNILARMPTPRHQPRRGHGQRQDLRDRRDCVRRRRARQQRGCRGIRPGHRHLGHQDLHADSAKRHGRFGTGRSHLRRRRDWFGWVPGNRGGV